MNRILLLLTLLFSVLFFWEAYPAEPPQEDTFGPEWTFSGPGGGPVTTVDLNLLANHMHTHLVVNQPAGEKFFYEVGKFTSPEGWWFQIKHDIGSIEVNAKPMTLSQWKKYFANINDAVFVSAANQNLFPALFRGGGHVNVGTQKMSPLLLRNFLMDLLNQNQLSMGILSYDKRNARPFEQAVSLDGQQKMLQLFADFDTGRLKYEFPLATDFFNDYQSYPKDENELFLHRFAHIFSSKATAITAYNTSRRVGEKIKRIEIRSVRPQASLDVFVRQIELLQGRLNYLRSVDAPIPYKPACKVIEYSDPYRPPVDPQEALRAFYVYVDQSGQPWERHRDYIWPEWRNAGGELEKFESSEWFIQREHDRYFYNCGALLR